MVRLMVSRRLGACVLALWAVLLAASVGLAQSAGAAFFSATVYLPNGLHFSKKWHAGPGSIGVHFFRVAHPDQDAGPDQDTPRADA
jgi:hypothetical protein